MPADEFKAPDDETPDETPDDDDTPDSSDDDEGAEGDDDEDDDSDYGITDSIGTGDVDGEAKPAVFVTTREPIALVVSRLDDPRAPESSALAAYIDGRMVARSAMPPEAIERLVDLKLFEEPVALGLFAYEEAPGLQCRLFALVPRTSLEADAHSSEPWKASVPSYESMRDAEDEMDDDMDDDDDEDGDDESPFETILLGHIVRFAKDRKYPDNLAEEAVDILTRIIHGAEPLEDADRKAIDDLLGSL
ncbi:hypothetical protein [Gemmatimonas groenlandica]|uniref:Uncharacterized protein n=1 Tax=Gemmatimonas groenlandica TaxID=2732249 RepID=A0A6M4IP25_9BACT|nr:hypothetical protein [Gemmatimonas groenlandica]QJR36490.1 hypothetical protein HKW67_13735 [Gemmatimonas groenlandica]